MIFYINKLKELLWTLFYYAFRRFFFFDLGSGCRFEGWVDITQRGGKIILGNNVRIRKNVELTVPKTGVLKIGSGSFIGSGVVISSHNKVLIGERSLIAEYVCIHDNNHRHIDHLTPTLEQGFVVGECFIGNNCWIGAGVKILMNAGVEDNSVIGAGSVLTKRLPGNVVAVGVPARVISVRGVRSD